MKIGAQLLLNRLSARELDVFKRLVAGEEPKEIAQAIGVSASSVHTYRGRIVEKTGLRNEVAMVHFAIANGLANVDATTPQELA